MIKVLLYNKLFKFIYGLLLLPLCYVMLRTLIYVISHVEFSAKIVQFFFAGSGVYVFLHFVLYKPIKIYIIGHEFMHMIATYLCGGKVRKFKLGSSSGMVNVDKVNTFIALSPYFVPFYSLLIVGLWCILKYIARIAISVDVLSFLLGFSLMFHFVLTLYAIYVGQQDFKISGWLFSIVLIFLINCSMLIFLFIFMFPSKLSTLEIQKFFFDFTKQSYYFCYTKIKEILQILLQKVQQK